MKQLKLFINNEYVESLNGEITETRNPANGEVIAEIPLGNHEDVDRAVKSARDCFNNSGWKDLSGDDRAEYMLRAAELLRKRLNEFAKWETMDVGKTITESETGDIPAAIRALEYFANVSREIKSETIPTPVNDSINIMTYEPYGVAGIIVPWNYPLHTATINLCAAIAAGNSVVLKPSVLASVTCLMFGEIIQEAGFPKGLINVVSGTGSAVGSPMASHPDIDILSFTGSPAIGRKVIEASAATRIKKVIMELGGKGPFIAHHDCNIEGAVNAALAGYLLTQGQCCCASTRLYLHETIYEEFMDLLVRKTKSLKIGDTLDRETHLGSLSSEDQLRIVDDFVKNGVSAGAVVMTGGKRYTEKPFDKGYYYEPTILAVEDNSMSCVQEEIFGPVLVVKKYRDMSEAVRMANDNEFGLGATVWSGDMKTLYWTAKQLDAGMVWCNTNLFTKIETPYGGFKNSGFGKVGGFAGVKEYMRLKNTVYYVGNSVENYFNV